MIAQMNILSAASTQWASRPNDERFVSLHEMGAAMAHNRSISRDVILSTRDVVARPVGDSHKGIEIVRRGGDHGYNPTHWSFGQIASLAGAPAGYLRKLPSELAADNINYGLAFNDAASDTKLMLRKNGTSSLMAATGANYGRVWNSDIVDALVRNFGDGVSGDWRVPGEFGKAVKVTKSNTTLYASDRDMFVFLADETNRIEIADRRDGKSGSLARGFFVWNSEVGSNTLGIASFMFDYVCANRIVWGAKEYRQIKIRHTVSAPDRFLEEVRPVLAQYANSSPAPVIETLKAAKAARLDKDVSDFLRNRRYTNSEITGIVQAHQFDEWRPMETLWDVVTGITAYARDIDHQNVRVKFETDAGKILDLVAVR